MHNTVSVPDFHWPHQPCELIPATAFLDLAVHDKQNQLVMMHSLPVRARYYAIAQTGHVCM